MDTTDFAELSLISESSPIMKGRQKATRTNRDTRHTQINRYGGDFCSGWTEEVTGREFMLELNPNGLSGFVLVRATGDMPGVQLMGCCALLS